jgi:hypothetical protein
MAKIVIGAAMVAGSVVAMAVNPELAGVALKMAELGISMGASLTMGGIADELRGGPHNGFSTRQPAAARQCIYGQVRVTGTIIYESTTGSSHNLNQVIAWAAHSCQSIDNLYLDGRQLHAGAAIGEGNRGLNATFTDDAGNKYNLGDVVWWSNLALGQSGGHWYVDLHNQNTAYWDDTCTLKGICATYLRCTYHSNAFPGIPGVKAMVHGKNDIYDPRTKTSGYTNNAALVIADFLCNSEFGIGCDYATEIDEDQLIAAANICDEQVQLAVLPTSETLAWVAYTSYTVGTRFIAGGVVYTVTTAYTSLNRFGLHDLPNITKASTATTESRYTINGFFDTNSAPGDTLDSMLMACEGHISYSGGRWKIYPAAWYGTNLAFDESDLTGKVQWTPKHKYRDLVNTVRATYVSPCYPYAVTGYDQDNKDTNIFNGAWQPTDAPEYAQDAGHGYDSDANLAADNDIKLYADRRYQFVTSCATVQRLMKIHLLRNRQQGSGILPMNLSSYQTQAQDVIEMSFPAFGWVDKYLEVQQFHFVPSINSKDGKTAPSIACELQVVETDPSVYSWSTAEERGVEDTPSPTLDADTTVNPPTNLALEDDSSTSVMLADGTSKTRMLVTWTAPDDPFVTSGGHIQIQYQFVTVDSTEPSGTLSPTQNADGTWSSGWVSGGQVNGDARYAYLDGIGGYQSITVQIRATRANGAASDWVASGLATLHAVCSPEPVVNGAVKTAQSTADTATTAASAAQTTANTATTIASTATTNIAQINSTDYLTNTDKIALMAKYAAELATKTALDSQATTWGASSTYYDNAVGAISTALINAGAPSNWATIWPDGTTGGPWINVQTILSNLWGQVATQRTALQAAISAGQAAQAQSAAISAAASDALTKSNAVQLASQPHQVAWAYASKPALPSSSYPAGYYAITADFHTVQVSTDGTAWNDVLVATSALVGQITTKQLVVMDYTNLCLNPSFEDGLNQWYADTNQPIVGVGTLSSNFAHSGTNALYLTSDGSTHEIDNGNIITCSPGDTYTASVWAYLSGTLSSGSATLYLVYSDKNGNTLGNNGGTALTLTSGSWVQTRTTGTTPTGCVKVKLALVNNGLTTGTVYLDDFDFRHCADASLIVDGSVTANKLVVGAAIADVERVGSLTANVIYFSDGFCLNSLETSSSILNKQGSIVPLQPFTFTYATTTTSVTITWSATTLYRSDGTTITISGGSATYSGLTANATYYMYPYVSIAGLTLNFIAAPSTSQNPVYAIQAQFDGRSPVSPLSFTTPSSGTAGGSGGDNCPEASETVDVQGKGSTRVDAVKIGDLIRGYDFAAKADVYRKVIMTNSGHCASWRVVDGHKVTPVEPVYFNAAWQSAYQASAVIDATVSRSVKIQVEAEDDQSHNYYLVSGTELLIHNMRAQLPC